MKRYTPIMFVVCAAAVAAFALLGDDSYSRLISMQKTLEHQKIENADLAQEVTGLRQEVHGIQTDDRMLEKAARDELGMARHGELVFLFDNYIE
jgi:cell division protein FtsB